MRILPVGPKYGESAVLILPKWRFTSDPAVLDSFDSSPQSRGGSMRTFAAVQTFVILLWSAVALASVPHPAAPQATAPEWRISATLAESCSCLVACPCNFGGKPNPGPCQGNRLLTIKHGHVGDVDLSGVSFLITWDLGKWAKVYESDKMTDAQKTAIETVIFPVAVAGFGRGEFSVMKAPITMEMTDSRVRFSTPESSVDMEVMKGFGGQPVRVFNLPNPAYQNYTQYRSVVHRHTDGDHSFSHTDTNGFTATWDAGSR